VASNPQGTPGAPGPGRETMLQALRQMPTTLVSRPQWLLWRFVQKKGGKKPSKLPYYVNGHSRGWPAGRPRDGLPTADQPNVEQGHELDRAALVSFEQAIKALESKRWDGIGFAFLPGDGLIGIDIDAAIDDDGQVAERCLSIIQACNSYTEYSPSGRGVHIFVQGETQTFKHDSIGLEVFCNAQFFAMTGHSWAGTPSDVRPIEPKVLARLQATVQAAKEAAAAKRAADTGAQPTRAASASRPVSIPAFWGDDFKRVNQAALAMLDAWVPVLFPAAKKTGRGYRVKSRDLGRDLQEDLSITSQGIRDFGVADMGDAQSGGRTPIDLVIEHRGETAKDALRWLAPLVGVALTPTTRRAAAKPKAKPAAQARAELGDLAGLDDADPADITPLIQKHAEGAGRLGADFADPRAAALCIVATLYTKAGRRVLHFWQGEFHFWARCHYSILPLADVREMLYCAGPVLSDKPVKKRSVDDVLDALKAAANLSHRLVPAVPAWVDRQSDDLDPRAVIPVRNGLVCVESGQLLPATPRLFVPYALPFNYAHDAAEPVEWLRFLTSVWREDRESIDALQEWLGYLLTADTSRQKALMIVGPRRSGKGTIGRVIVQLLGERNVASPTLASLGNNFGLEPLIGKTAALMSDARLGARADIAAVAENLLRLTGEDTISIDRKFKEAYSAKLLARVVVLTNELPVFRDAASALPSRFILLRTARSFYGQEDHGLDGKLAAELPGILVWALAGLRRLRQRGRFVQPAAGAAQLQMMEDLASPISTFVRDTCIVEPGGQVPIAKLHEAWRDWCKEHGRDQPGPGQTFGRDIAAAVPSAGHSRPRINGARVRMYDGLRLRTPDDPGEDEDDAA
jgi:putative DNA primase/helicase